MTKHASREVRLKAFPVGMPTDDDFEIVSTEIDAPSDGEVLVKNIWMSVDPYMRGRMTQRDSYIEGFKPGSVLEGHAVGQVVASKTDKLPEGSYVVSMNGWREAFVSGPQGLNRVDPSIAPIEAFIGVLGMPGITAYAGLLRVGGLKDGDTVFVSAASGAVGSLVCQIAKIKGHYVVGSAGSDEKCAWLIEEAGIDAAINYKTAGPLTPLLKDHFPKGIDVYFENVGGAHLVAALDTMANGGRIAVCGMIDQYNATEAPQGPSNLTNLIIKSLRMEGFVVTNHLDMLGDFYQDVGGWIKAGKVKWNQTVFEGLEQAPAAFQGLFTGANFGKMLVKIGPDPAY